MIVKKVNGDKLGKNIKQKQIKMNNILRAYKILFN